MYTIYTIVLCSNICTNGDMNIVVLWLQLGC